jgi:ribosomal protein S18 acetylase RimI-like enzyme
VLRPALAKSLERGEVLVSENSKGIVGFVEYHHRRDEQTTLYHIAVYSDHRRLNIGKRLIAALADDAREHGKRFIQLKCPVDLDANTFYRRLGFSRAGVQPGKNRDLAIWRLQMYGSLVDPPSERTTAPRKN